MTLAIITIGLIIAIAVLLVLVVLAQNSKGGGLTAGFGGPGSSQLMGVKKTNDILEKLTWGFAIAIMVLTISTGFMIDKTGAEGAINSVNVERARSLPSQTPVAPNIDAATAPMDTLGSLPLGTEGQTDSQ
jgi:preprotein translocase subunit SecG